jgi:hypothetical protein
VLHNPQFIKGFHELIYWDLRKAGLITLYEKYSKNNTLHGNNISMPTLYGWPTTVVLPPSNEDIDKTILEIRTVITIYKFHLSVVQFTVQNFCEEIPDLKEGQDIILTTEEIVRQGEAIKVILSKSNDIKQTDSAIASAYKELIKKMTLGKLDLEPFHNLVEATNCSCQHFTATKSDSKVALKKRNIKINIMTQGNKNITA